jgi:surface antigen
MTHAMTPTTVRAFSSCHRAALLLLPLAWPLSGAALAGCAAAPAVPIAAAAGAGGGAAAGATIGSGTGQVAAAAAGGALGGLAGVAVGQRLDEADKERAARAERRAVTENTAVEWNGTGSAHGTVSPRRAFVDAEGRPCREFAHRIEIDGRAEEAVGVYCQHGDGFWRLDAGSG